MRRTVGAKVAADIRADTGNDAITVAAVELTDQAIIAAFVVAWDTPLDILVNNGGVMAIQELTLTDRGNELQFATNHLSHSPSRSDCTARWPPPGTPASCRSAPAVTSAHQ
ncbi:MAG: hypothetical protein ACRDTX_31310 [Pseudonocardiaceae bacterium]